VPLFGDRDGHPGTSAYEAARLALYRDGTLVRESTWPGDRFVVPEEPGGYRLEASATRGGSDLSTEVSGAWTFRSGHVGGRETPAKLPIQVVRFTPTLDERNAAAAGRRFEIPVTVQRQPGTPAAAVQRISVEISYDDGPHVAAGAAPQDPGRLVGHGRAPGWRGLRVTAGQRRRHGGQHGDPDGHPRLPARTRSVGEHARAPARDQSSFQVARTAWEGL
jgi:hypothetical protein